MNISNKIKKRFPEDDLRSFTSLFNKARKTSFNWNHITQKTNGLIDIIDLFSGCGGMSLGFSFLDPQLNLFNFKGAIDINPIALEAYQKNFNSKILNKDIRELCNNNGLKLIRKAFELPNKKKNPLIIIGCAPCQGFSNHRKKNWEQKDDRNTLIGAFTETALKLDPDFVVMENVPEILGKKYWAHYDEARNIFESQGYFVKQTIYNSASFGVPQARFRAVIIASKLEFNLPTPVLEKENFVTVRDAIYDLPKVEAGEICESDKYHKSARHKPSTINTISQIPKNGGSRPSGVGPNCLDKIKGFSDVYGRLFWDKPSITLTQYARNPASGRFTHPELNRGLTIREAARLQSFPDAFKFQGSLDQCFKQIGESVPPLLATAIASQILLSFSKKVIYPANKEIQSITSPIRNLYSPVSTPVNPTAAQL